MSLEVSVLRALAHPVRLRILSLLTGSVLSASEISRELGISQANVSYHMRILVAAQMIVETEEDAGDGGLVKRYAHLPDESPVFPAEADSSVVLFRAAAEELVRRAAIASDTTPRHFSDAELWVDPEDWGVALSHVREAMSTLHRRAYPPRTEGTIPVSATVALFGLNEGQASRSGDADTPNDVVERTGTIGEGSDTASGPGEPGVTGSAG